MKTFDVLGVKIFDTNMAQAVEQIKQWIASREKTYVCFATAATLVDCQKDQEYKNIINAAGMTTPDGMPLVWLGKRAGSKNIARTYGPDLMLSLCEVSQEKGSRHFFYGGSEDTNVMLVRKLRERFPQLKIVGRYAPPVLGIDALEEDEILKEINAAAPDILWVGLGSPKQDYWMARHRGLLNVPVMIGVGAAFDFLSGAKPQAPKWMQRSGLEWFFRLLCEPRRLWKRYCLGNLEFIFYLVKDFLRRKKS